MTVGDPSRLESEVGPTATRTFRSPRTVFGGTNRWGQNRLAEGTGGAFQAFLTRLSTRFTVFRRPRTEVGSAALSYRFLARQIENDLPSGELGRTILLSSSMPQAMSNEASLMFAHAMTEELGARVLLVDGTFGDRGVGAAVGVKGEAGFQDLLYESGPLDPSLIRQTDKRGIFVLPSGRPRKGAPRPIEPERLLKVYEELTARFSYVLVQQGAITVDTRYLVCAARTDLILILVQEGLTPVNDLDRCLEVLQSRQITSFRLVLCESG